MDRANIGTVSTASNVPDGLYECSEDCPEGQFHEHFGCEACHNPNAPYIVKFATWETAYCERCARQLRSEGHSLSKRGETLADDQIALFDNQENR